MKCSLLPPTHHPLTPKLATPTIKTHFSPIHRFKSYKPISASPSSSEQIPPNGNGDPPPESAADPIKLAFAKAAAYKKSRALSDTQTVRQAVNSDKGSDGDKNPVLENTTAAGQEKQDSSISNNVTLSTQDFLGLDFSEKKTYRGLPPGLAPPTYDPLADGKITEVEIILGDPTKFGNSSPRVNDSEKDENMGEYKPKVSTWGVFPRPSNISKTYGGGRVIRPGEALETAEDEAAKAKRSRELIAAYRNNMSTFVDPKIKAECEKVFEEGDELMDCGRLREALPFYEKVMKEIVFQNELHGRAALQWSICQDSLRRPNEAISMYEKLQSHPNSYVSKKARHLAFSFRAMEVMKVRDASLPRITGYESYFDKFVDKKDNYTVTEEGQNEYGMNQTLPYIVFLLSPIFIVLLFAVRKSFLL